MRSPPARFATAAIFGCPRFGSHAGTRFVKALNSEGDLIAIGEARLPHLYHPVLVL